MDFLVIVASFAVVQYLDSLRYFQRDEWLVLWDHWLAKRLGRGEAKWTCLVLVPVVLVWLLLALVESLSSWLVFVLAVPLFLFSIGRADIKALMGAYTEASRRRDNEVATNCAEAMGVDSDPVSGWDHLHAAVLRQAGYLGLEKWFVPIFWLLLLGPIGPVLYRLARLSATLPQAEGMEGSQLAERLCALLEWPVVRLLGLSFALTGNFVSCVAVCQKYLFSTELNSAEVMERSLHGALDLNDASLQQISMTEAELESVPGLLQRSLILWMCVLAVLSL